MLAHRFDRLFDPRPRQRARQLRRHQRGGDLDLVAVGHDIERVVERDDLLVGDRAERFAVLRVDRFDLFFEFVRPVMDRVGHLVGEQGHQIVRQVMGELGHAHRVKPDVRVLAAPGIVMVMLVSVVVRMIVSVAVVLCGFCHGDDDRAALAALE